MFGDQPSRALVAHRRKNRSLATGRRLTATCNQTSECIQIRLLCETCRKRLLVERTVLLCGSPNSDIGTAVIFDVQFE